MSNDHQLSVGKGDDNQKAAELKFVIDSLETLADHKRTPIQRVIDLGRRFVAACFPTQSSRKLLKQNDSPQARLVDAIAVIKNHYLKYEGISEKKAVVKANAQPANVTMVPTAASQRISALRTAPWHVSKPAQGSATPHELDLFLVKAISLIRSHTLRTASLKEALEAIRQAPILQTTIPGSSQQGVITLRQTVRLFPQDFDLEGSFQRNAHSKIVSIPLPDSFHLVMRFQTGHPLPMQHHGWALPSQFPFPLEGLKNAPTLQWLSSQKERISHEFSIGGPTADRAERLLKQKQTAFKRMRGECLELHLQLAEQMVAAAGSSAQDPIRAYFQWLEGRSDEFEQLSQLYQLLNDSFLSDPGETNLAATWLTTQERHPAKDYLIVLGPLLARGWQRPQTLFGRQIQHAFFHQVWNFIEELEEDSVIADRLLAALKRDIECFKTDPLIQVTTVPQRAVAELRASLLLQ